MKSAVRRLSLSQAQDTERTPLIDSRPKQRVYSIDHGLTPARREADVFGEDDEAERPGEVEIDRRALFCLLAQHTSGIFGASIVNYAAFIFLAECFSDTLAPASTMGMVTCVSPVVFASWVGGLVDRTERLRYIRVMMVAQKVVQVLIYACFGILLGPLRDVARDALHHSASVPDAITIWSTLAILLIFVCISKIADVGMGVAIEKDWVLTISQGDPVTLTRLNTSMRMIATMSRIFPPIVVAAFVVAFGYRGSAIAMAVTTAINLAVEWWWLRVVFTRFPILRQDDIDRQAARAKAVSRKDGQVVGNNESLGERIQGVKVQLGEQITVWRTFSAIPVFYTSLASAGLWLSTLSLDGTGVSYFKLMHGWNEVVLAKIRIASLSVSLLGSFLVPYVEPRLGTSATALTSLLLGLGCLLVSLVGFFLEPSGPSGSPTTGFATYATTLMIVPIILSRLGFVAYDLCQLKQLQLGLADRLDRNRLTALHSALTNLFAFGRFGLLFVISDPALFKWTAVVTVGAAVWSVGCYLTYLVKVGRRYSETP